MKWILKFALCIAFWISVQSVALCLEVIRQEERKDYLSGQTPEFILLPHYYAWGALVDKVLKTGEYSPKDWPLLETYRLKHLYPDEAGPHKAEYINVWGHKKMGEFISSYVTMVSENWAINEKNQWIIDQWIFKLEMDGSIITATNKTIIENKDSKIIDIIFKPLELCDPRVKLKRDAMIQVWIDY